MKKIFVSFPVSSSDPEVKKNRIKVAKMYCLALLLKGHNPINPTLFGIALIEGTKADLSSIAWEEYCNSHLEGCDEFHILTLPGWEESNGIAKELKNAYELKIPVWEINPLKN